MYEQILSSQKDFFDTGKTLDIDFRISVLHRLYSAIKNNNGNIASALNDDFGKSEFEIFTTETMLILDEIKFAIKNLKRWNKPQRVKTPIYFFKSKSRIYYQPYGNVLVIGAWNYPLQLTLLPMIGAIAAGNTCIVKPSELSIKTSALIKKLIDEVFDPAHCTVVEGAVAETTELLKQRFDLIHYTGSSSVGKIVAQAAAIHLTPTILELGGKSPCIIDKTANIEITTRRILWGKFINSGQTCVAPDYVLIDESVKDKFIETAKKQIQAFYGNSIFDNPDYCRIINNNHFDRLCKLIDGENIVIGGKSDRDKLKIEPTIVEPKSWNCPLMQDEIFGPILPVFTFSDLSEVKRRIRSKERPLALYLFTTNSNTKKDIVNALPFGDGCINTTVMHTGNIHLPFGGIGNSGMGSYHGKWSFEAFSHKKSILDKSLKIDIKFLYPPYKDKIKLLYRFLLK